MFVCLFWGRKVAEGKDFNNHTSLNRNKSVHLLEVSYPFPKLLMSLGDAAHLSSLSHPLAPVVKLSHLIQTTAVASDPPSSVRLKGDARDGQPRYRGWVRAELGLG